MSYVRVLASLAVLAMLSSASQAAVVLFQGTVVTASASTGFLGAVPPSRNFSMVMTIPDGAGPNAAGIAGTMSFTGFPTQTITSGTLNLVDSGATDTVSFNFNTPTGLGLFSFTGNLITGTAVNQGNLNGLNPSVTEGLRTTGFSFIDLAAGGVVYQGSITAVPEPGTCLALLGLVGGGAWKLRRKKSIA